MNFYSQVKENVWVGIGSAAGLTAGIGANLLRSGSLFEKSFSACSNAFNGFIPFVAINNVREKALFSTNLFNPFIPLIHTVPMLTSSLWNTFNPNPSQKDKSLLTRGWQNLSTQVISPLIHQNLLLGGSFLARYLFLSTSVNPAIHVIFQAANTVNTVKSLEGLSHTESFKQKKIYSILNIGLALTDAIWLYNSAANCYSIADTISGVACVALGLVGLEACKSSVGKRCNLMKNHVVPIVPNTKSEKFIKAINSSSQDDASHQKTDEKEAISDKPQSNSLTSEIHSGLINKINRVFWIGMGCWSTYNLMDSGLARLFALETLTHGTGPLGYIGINLNGADPNYGGGKTGSSVGGGEDFHVQNSKNFFHVFKDSAFSEAPCAFSEAPCHDTPVPILCNMIGNQVLPRYHAVLSGMANFGYSAVYNTGNIVQGAIGAVSGFVTPTLKFRFTPEEIFNCNDTCRFENDPDYFGAAYRTSKAINASQLGIWGSVSQGIDSGMFNRMSANPKKVLLGITLLGAAALVARTTYRYINSAQQVKLNTSEISSDSTSQSIPYFQNCKKKLKVLAVNSCWVTLALTTIFLNTV